MVKKAKKLIYNLLKKSEKFTGTDNVYIAKHGAFLTLGNIIGIISSFLLSIAFAQLLPKETFGQYKYILSIMSLLAIFSLEGMNKAIIRSVAMGIEGVFKSGLKTKIKWSLIGSILSIGLAIFFWFRGNVEFTISFLIISLFLPIIKGSASFEAYLSGK